ncbi:MAG: hypothetical protein KKH40_05735, partial [Nanoarchaeota archaeon]|nr:hypothetical protein [Nanoarchaeota archaeon]
MKEIAEFIIKKIESLECGDDCPSFSNNELIPVNISQENYHEIKPRKDEQIICFVDGGNSELISANNISLQFIRMAAVFYKGQQKLFRKNKEFYCLTYFEDNFFKTKIFPKDAFLEPTFNSFDETLMSGRTRVKITKIAQAIRRLAELSFAEEQAKNSSCNFLVLDGSL